MKIFADRNILAVEESFSRHGELHLFDGRSVTREEIREADVLLVRSITRVDEPLLTGSNVRFVGTATSGIDHIDTDYLSSRGIALADARGSNANAVVDYCFAALAYATEQRQFSLNKSSVGIVGAGAVGGLFAAKLEALGADVRRCDPILAERADSEHSYYSLEETLECDAVSLHVPLTPGGPHATQKLIGQEQLERLGRDSLLINACRGGVVDEAALRRVLSERDDIVTVFDVWEAEPAVDAGLVQAVTLATPHIAGYSLEAKSNATAMLAKSFVEHFGLEPFPTVRADAAIPIEFESETNAHWQALLAVFPLRELSTRFKAAVGQGTAVEAFDRFRKELVQRREFASHRLGRQAFSAEQRDFLTTLGFLLE